MDKKQQYLETSLKHLQIADHIAYVTYPLVNEKKLLLKIFEEIHKSLISLITAILIYENKKNKIKLYIDNEENVKNYELKPGECRVLDHYKNAFSSSGSKSQNMRKEHFCDIKNFVKLSQNYNINPEEIKKILDIIEINNKHKNSAMEFSRKEHVVIMLDNLNTYSLDIQKIKEYLALAKSLYIRVNLVLNN